MSKSKRVIKNPLLIGFHLKYAIVNTLNIYNIHDQVFLHCKNKFMSAVVLKYLHYHVRSIVIVTTETFIVSVG